MPRKATGPRYYPSRQGYYVTFQGRQHCLALGSICLDCQALDKQRLGPQCKPCKEPWTRAVLAWEKLTHDATVDKQEDNCLVNSIAERYLKFLQEQRSDNTFECATRLLMDFNKEVGHLRVKQLKGSHLEDWLASHTTWNCSTKRRAIDIVSSMFNRAKKMGLITLNPALYLTEKPSRLSRIDTVKPEDHAAMLARLERRFNVRHCGNKFYMVGTADKTWHLATGDRNDSSALALAQAKAIHIRQENGIIDPFTLIIMLAHHTGARPGEIYNAQAKDWKENLSAFFYPAMPKELGRKVKGFTHKNARKGKTRQVNVSDPVLVGWIRFLCKKYPTGPLFRNQKGKQWTDFSVAGRLTKLKAKLGITATLTAYTYRHTRATELIEAGHPLSHVAEWLGTSVQMLEKHYSHLSGRPQVMANKWAQANSNGPVNGLRELTAVATEAG